MDGKVQNYCTLLAHDLIVYKNAGEGDPVVLSDLSAPSWGEKGSRKGGKESVGCTGYIGQCSRIPAPVWLVL